MSRSIIIYYLPAMTGPEGGKSRRLLNYPLPQDCLYIYGADQQDRSLGGIYGSSCLMPGRVIVQHQDQQCRLFPPGPSRLTALALVSHFLGV